MIGAHSQIFSGPLTWFWILLGLFANSAAAEPAYVLEQLELRGSDRISDEQLRAELNLANGSKLTDEFVINARQKLLGLGLFKSVVLLMRKGSARGRVRLIVELEDEPSVLTSWGIGTRIGLKYSDRQTVAAAATSPPFGFEVEVLGRNIAKTLHRGGLLADLDGNGVVRRSRLIYGVPRFAAEDIQFDTKIELIDAKRRYLESKGFGGEIEAFWSKSTSDFKIMRFGTAMLLNRGKRYGVPFFPDAVAGPKVVYEYDNRFHSFLPHSGFMYSAGALYNPLETRHSVLDLSTAVTLSIVEACWASFGLDGRAVGSDGYSARGEFRFDFPVTNVYEAGEQAIFSLRFRGGQDEFKGQRTYGSSAVLGLKYYSDGLIAELAFQVTQSPREFGPLKGRVNSEIGAEQ